MKVKLTSQTDQQNLQEHYVFQPSIEPDACKATIEEPQPIFEKLLNRHAEQFSDSINIPQWREVIWSVKTPLASFNPTQLSLHYSTSYEAQAIRLGYVTTTKTLGLVALIKTIDDYFIFGLRTGAAMGGYLCNAPAGHCAPEQPGINPVLGGFLEELETELAITNEEISEPKLLGYQSDPDFGRGVNLVMYANARLSFQDIQQRHQEAYTLAMKASQAGKNYTEIKATIHQAGLRNIDAHEHDLLVSIPADRKTLTTLIEERSFEYDQFNPSTKTYEKRQSPVMDITRGSLLIYLGSGNIKD